MLPSLRKTLKVRSGAFSFLEVLVALVVVGLIAALVLPALSQAKDQSRATRCIDNSRMIGAAFTEYADNNHGHFVEFRQKKPSPKEAIVATNNKEYTYWPDLLSEYAGDNSIWHCPCCQYGEQHGFGIGYSKLMDESDGNDHQSVGNVDDLADPSRTVVFGDTDVVENPQSHPDAWQSVGLNEVSPVSRLQFDVPASLAWGDLEKTKPRRILNRHFGRANVVFADQHVESIKVSRLGFQKEAKVEQRLWDRH